MSTPTPKVSFTIPALKDRDWRELARKRKSLYTTPTNHRNHHRYVPPSAKAVTGADGSVGGLGTRDTINSGPQLSGIQIRKRVKMEVGEGDEVVNVMEVKEEDEEETDDQKAMRAILASTQNPNDDGSGGPIVDIIPQRRVSISETDAYRQDVQDFPDEATLDDYARVPVSQFGAALLRGMGWKEGAPSVTKKNGAGGKGARKHVEPWIPTARPALLGIGAKEQEVYDDGGGNAKGRKTSKVRPPEKRYVPLVQKKLIREGEWKEERRDSSRHSSPPRERERGSAPGSSSRRGSRSPSPSRRRHRDRDYDDRDRDRANRERDRDRDRDSERDRESRRNDRDRRDYDRDREQRRRREGQDKGS